MIRLVLLLNGITVTNQIVKGVLVFRIDLKPVLIHECLQNRGPLIIYLVPRVGIFGTGIRVFLDHGQLIIQRIQIGDDLLLELRVLELTRLQRLVIINLSLNDLLKIL